MSKQSEAKIRQGYREEPHNCGNCEHRTFERKFGSHDLSPTLTAAWEVNQRCAIGGFAVKKTATCQRWSRAANSKPIGVDIDAIHRNR